jgi:hypothetical protein
MANETQIQIGSTLAVFDGQELKLRCENQADLELSLSREEVLELFDFISRFTHTELNRRTSFRVPVVSPDNLTVRIAIDMKLIDARPLDMSLNGILVQIEDHRLNIENEEPVPAMIQLGMGQQSIKLEGHLRRKSGDKLSFQFDSSNWDACGEPPELLVDMFMELQRDWLTSRFRQRPV